MANWGDSPNWAKLMPRYTGLFERYKYAVLSSAVQFWDCIHSNGFCSGPKTEELQSRSSFIKREQDKRSRQYLQPVSLQVRWLSGILTGITWSWSHNQKGRISCFETKTNVTNINAGARVRKLRVRIRMTENIKPLCTDCVISLTVSKHRCVDVLVNHTF